MNQMTLIRDELKKNLGKRVIVKANKGRKKYITRCGILRDVYPSIFTMDMQNGEEVAVVTFTYSDVLTGNVKITILEDDVELKDVKKIS